MEPHTIPRRDTPSSVLRRTPTGPAPETPRYLSPEGTALAEPPAAEKKAD